MVLAAQNSKHLVGFIDLAPRDPHSSQAHPVEAHVCATAGHGKEWQYIPGDASQDPDHRSLTDADKLVDCDVPRQNGSLSDVNIAPEQDAVHQRDVVLNDAVVGHMTTDHEQAAIPDLSHGPRSCSPVDGHVLSDHRIVTDIATTHLAREGTILRDIANHRPRVNLAASSDRRIRTDMTHRCDAGLGPDPDMGFDNAESPDRRRGRDLS